MLKLSKISLIAITLAAILSGVSSQRSTNRREQANGNSTDCLIRADRLDKCLIKLTVYGDRSFQPPRSDEQLDEHCLGLDDNVKCVASYSRECLPSFARNIYSIILRRLKGQFAKRCKTPEGRKDFLDMMACADPKHMEPANKCMDSFIAQLEHAGRGNQDRQIELTCCAFQVFQECIFAASKKMKCAERVVSSDRSINYVKSIINSMGGDVMEFMCGKYDKVSVCKAGHPKVMAQFQEISERIHNGTMRPISSSPIKPMLKLFLSGSDE